MVLATGCKRAHINRKSALQDPLSNAVARANELNRACSNVEVELLDAGHCPHDEVPHLVNSSLLGFMQKVASAEEPSSIAGGTEKQPVSAVSASA